VAPDGGRIGLSRCGWQIRLPAVLGFHGCSDYHRSRAVQRAFAARILKICQGLVTPRSERAPSARRASGALRPTPSLPQAASPGYWADSSYIVAILAPRAKPSRAALRGLEYPLWAPANIGVFQALQWRTG
jgi:hypothetical protein